jgi:hypothetical protein
MDPHQAPGRTRTISQFGLKLTTTSVSVTIGFVRLYERTRTLYTDTRCDASRPMPMINLIALLLLHAPLFIQGKSLPPDPGKGTAFGNECSVRLVRRTSLRVGCFPVGETGTGYHGTFGCESNTTMFVTGGCAGLFYCGTGGVMCGKSHDTGRTQCACTLDTCKQGRAYGKCPPAPPPMAMPDLPPLPPTPPMSPAHVETAKHEGVAGGHAGHLHHEHATKG